MTETRARARGPRALILQHEDPTPPGHVTDWLGEHDAEIEVYRIDLEERGVDPRDFDLIVSLGSEFAAFDDTKPFVPREARLMERALEADVPILGLCFGGQLLARVLGADAQGNTFFGLAMGREPLVMCVKYTPSGQRSSEFILKGVTGTGEVTGRVDQHGNLYVSRFSETSSYIDKYSPRSEIKWVPRSVSSK